jgi:hypothetical protein
MRTLNRHTLWIAAAAALVACGKPSNFSSKGNEPEPTPAPTPVPVQARAPIQGYEDPELRGSAMQKIGGPTVLGNPVDPDETAVLTKIENGTPTKIGGVTGPITDKTTGITCPGGIIIGTCVPGLPVFRWGPVPAPDDARTLSSSCKGESSPACDAFQARANELGIKYSGKVAFVAFGAPEAGNTQLSNLMTSITLCHGSLDSPNPGGEYVLTAGLSCVKFSETLWGFREPQTTPGASTMPLYQWSNGSSILFNLSKDTTPAPGFLLKSATPILHVLPPT